MYIASPIKVFTYALSLSFIIPALAALVLFNLDGRRADLFMISSLFLAASLFFYVFLNYVIHGYGALHIAIIKRGSVEFFGFLIDPISMLISFVVWTAGSAFMLYSIAYMSPHNREHPVEKGKGKFYGWMMLFIAATAAFIVSSTLLQMLMFFELMSLACWGVVSYYAEPQCRRAALKAFITTHVGALSGLFIALTLCLIATGDVSLYGLKRLPTDVKLLIFLSLLIAAITKSAQFPTYSWLPDAMVAPTPASAFLHGAAMIEMGVYLLARGVQFLMPLPIEAFYTLLAIVCLTLVITAVMYVPQRDAKRLLAYSTIAESATMYAALVPACLGIERGIYVSMYILALHAYVKGLAFLTTGLFSYYIGDKTIDRVKGLLTANSFAALCWIIALFGLAGAPPMPLFFGKLVLFTVLGEALTQNPYIAALIVALALDIASFGIAAIRWVHATVLSQDNVAQFKLQPTFAISMGILLALLFIIPYISSPLMRIGW